jgi:hypothetical protein
LERIGDSELDRNWIGIERCRIGEVGLYICKRGSGARREIAFRNPHGGQ